MSSYSRRGGRRGGHNTDNDRPKHPKHLKGREIGLFYAKQAKLRRTLEGNGERKSKPLGTVELSISKRRQIEAILDTDNFQNYFRITDRSYNLIKDSNFKKDYLRIINESIQDKLSIVDKELKRDLDLDTKLYELYTEKRKDNSRYQRMLKQRQKLPSYSKREEILKLIDENQVVVISGETGCGKTTQVAQFILDEAIEKRNGSMCKVVCTQPRRISAISVAERVADERAESLGDSVGFQIRLEWRFPRNRGSILFCTTGIVLKLMESDPALSTVSHLILDEIHERNVESDFILALVKQVIRQRSDLKVILMSATLNAEKFSEYYNNAPCINIPGFTYPVTEYYLEDVLERTKFSFPAVPTGRDGAPRQRFANKNADRDYQDYIEPHLRLLEAERKYSRHVLMQLKNPQSEQLNLELILALLIDICEKEKEQGAILVFVTGFLEISSLIQLMEKSGQFPTSKFTIFPLHSLMPSVDQKQIFQPPPEGVRKIIVATNIAETSITIDDVVFVVDCGRIKMSNFDVTNNSQTLKAEWVSLANASQRKGRAGRVKAGICFHLFTRARRMLLDEYQLPEILRSRLEGVILTAKILRLGQIESFFLSLIDSPEPDAVRVALDLLKQLNALNDDESLTPLGYHLAKLPMAPQLGKMILFGAIFSCLDPILCVAATLDFKDAFHMPIGKEKEVDRKRMELSDGIKSDHILFYKVLKGFEDNGNNGRNFCWNNFLSLPTIKLLSEMRWQLAGHLKEMNFVPTADPRCRDCNRNSENLSLVKAIICAGLYPNVLLTRRHGAVAYTLDRKRVSAHPRSILKTAYFDCNFLVYYNRIKTGSDMFHDGTLVNSLPVIFFGDHYEEEHENERLIIQVHRNLRFQCNEDTALIIKELRDRFNWFLEYKISHPGPVKWTQGDEETKILKVIMELITSEDLGEFDEDFELE